MADEKVKVPDLATASTPDGNEYTIVSQSGVLRKIKLKDLPVQTALQPVETTYADNTAYSIPGGVLLEKVVITATAGDIVAKIGSTAGGNDILFDTAIANGASVVASIDVYSDPGSPADIYISLSGDAKVKYYKR